MSLTLIDYSSSESENDQKSDTNLSSDERIQLNESQLSSDPKISTINGSIANPFDSNNYDESSTSSEDESNETHLNRDLNRKSEISTASSVGNLSSIQSINSFVSIFNNPFKEEENKERTQLERHVKMSDPQENALNVDQTDGKGHHKTICWNYHKHKKCKFGNRCKFLHNDTNFIATKKPNSETNKKRTGITDSLIPPAKALKTYYSQRNE